MLLATFKARSGLAIEFAQAVRPERYKLFQVADMIATLKLVELKIEHGEPMTESEYKFFGGPRNFKRNYLRFVKAKEISPLMPCLQNPPAAHWTRRWRRGNRRADARRETRDVSGRHETLKPQRLRLSRPMVGPPRRGGRHCLNV